MIITSLLTAMASTRSASYVGLAGYGPSSRRAAANPRKCRGTCAKLQHRWGKNSGMACINTRLPPNTLSASDQRRYRCGRSPAAEKIVQATSARLRPRGWSRAVHQVHQHGVWCACHGARVHTVVSLPMLMKSLWTFRFELTKCRTWM